MRAGRPGVDTMIALAIAAVLAIIYNANGREISSYDSQPTKFAARELLVRGTLALNHVVGAVPAYAERNAFVRCRDGRYRSAYSPVPAVLAAGLAWPLVHAGAIDVRSAGTPALMSKLTASLLTALAVALLYVAARARLERGRAVVLALGVGLGTGLWPVVSQTIWQHETAIFGMALAIAATARGNERLSTWDAAWAAVGLALAGSSRPQLAPMIAIVLIGIFRRAPLRAAAIAGGIVAGSALALMLVYLRWYGSPLGGVSLLTESNDALHGTRGWINWRFEGFAGLLLSPSRGLLIFSPIALLVLPGFINAWRASWSSPLRWCAAAAIAQFLLYSGYAVWWGGHTYGPRYILDVLPVLVPLAAAALARVRLRSVTGMASVAALAWSIALSATGAFCYPHEQWNTLPEEIDLAHARLWDWSDPQFVRCWHMGLSPQNFQLFIP